MGLVAWCMLFNHEVFWGIWVRAYSLPWVSGTNTTTKGPKGPKTLVTRVPHVL